MEPLRGGALSNQAPDKVREIFKNYKTQRSPANWALRFVMNHEGVGTVLSGMNVTDHIKDNIDAADNTPINSCLRLLRNIKVAR